MLLIGTVPYLFVRYITKPFVAYIHLQLPPFARQSRDILLRYVNNLPPNATLTVTMLNAIGRPRQMIFPVKQLSPCSTPLGVANYARDTKLINANLPWWVPFRAQNKFLIQDGGDTLSREKGIWRAIAKGISKNSKADT